jgi:hypothetical protein
VGRCFIPLALTIAWLSIAGPGAASESGASTFPEWRRVAQFVVALVGCGALWVGFLFAERANFVVFVSSLVVATVLFVMWLILI